ncbi:MAG: hypothetical protein R3A52_03170 [Polyangiales bacterium]
MPPIGPARALSVLALTAACVVTTEVLFTRVLSVSTWYGLAFVVLSLAMLGVTRGGLAAARSPRSRRARVDLHRARAPVDVRRRPRRGDPPGLPPIRFLHRPVVLRVAAPRRSAAWPLPSAAP